MAFKCGSCPSLVSLPVPASAYVNVPIALGGLASVVRSDRGFTSVVLITEHLAISRVRFSTL